MLSVKDQSLDVWFANPSDLMSFHCVSTIPLNQRSILSSRKESVPCLCHTENCDYSNFSIQSSLCIESSSFLWVKFHVLYSKTNEIVLRDPERSKYIVVINFSRTQNLFLCPIINSNTVFLYSSNSYQFTSWGRKLHNFDVTSMKPFEICLAFLIFKVPNIHINHFRFIRMSHLSSCNQLQIRVNVQTWNIIIMKIEERLGLIWFIQDHSKCSCGVNNLIRICSIP